MMTTKVITWFLGRPFFPRMQEQRADQYESQETFHADKLHLTNLVSDLDLYSRVIEWAWVKTDGC